MNIPVIGIPVLNRGDLLLRCVKSLNGQFDKLVIVNNGDDEGVQNAIDEILKTEMAVWGHIARIVIHKPFNNLGVAASWNWILTNHPADHTMLIGNDMTVGPSDIDDVAAGFTVRPGFDLICGNFGYSVIVISRRAVEVVGLFDENFYPGYFEDNDWDRRFRMTNLVAISKKWTGVHGDENQRGSCTINSDPVLKSRNGQAFERNRAYYIRKWGGQPREEKFQHPFNDPNWPLSKWELGPERMQNFALINS